MSSIWNVRRSASDVKVTGLCGGVAEHWDVDPVLVRVGWVLLALSGGVGVVLYLAGWLLVPVRGRTTSTADDLFGATTRKWPKEVWVTLVVLVCLAVFAASSSATPFGVGPALVIACVWYFGFYRSRRARDAATPPAAAPLAPPAPPAFVAHPGPATAFTVAADQWRRRIEEHTRQSGTPVAASWPGAPTAPATVQDPAPVEDTAVPAETAHRAAYLAEPDPVGLYVAPVETAPVVLRRGAGLAARRLRLATVLVLGLALGGLGLAAGAGVSITPAVYAATALLVVGLALVAATWLGRARGLLALGLLLVPLVVVTSALPYTDLEAWSSSTLTYTPTSPLPVGVDDLGSGQRTVDLSGLAPTTDVTYSAHLENGQLEVVVPADVNVVVRYAVDYGVVEGPGVEALGGTDLAGTLPTTSEPDRPTLTLDLAVDHGQLQVVTR